MSCLRIYAIICLIFLTGISNSLDAQQRKLSVAFAHWPPWKIIENDRIDGIDARIVRALAKRVDVAVDFYVCPWPRCIDMLKNGEVDLITSFGKNQNRQKFTYYLGPAYRQDDLTFWVNKDSSIQIEAYEDLENMKIGAIKGSIYFNRFDADETLKKSLVDQEYQMFLMLKNNRIDAFIGYDTVINYQLLIKGFNKQFRNISYRAPGKGSYIAMSKKSGSLDLMSKLTDAINKMTKEGEIQNIINSFLDETGRRVTKETGQARQD